MWTFFLSSHIVLATIFTVTIMFIFETGIQQLFAIAISYIYVGYSFYIENTKLRKLKERPKKMSRVNNTMLSIYTLFLLYVSKLAVERNFIEKEQKNTGENKLYIIQCLNELPKPGRLDYENTSSRLYVDKKDGKFLEDGKMNPWLSNFCNNEEVNNVEVCTYNGALEFVEPPYSSLKCSYKSGWDNIISFVKNHSSKSNFYMVSHHHRLQQLLKPFFPKGKSKIANCACFRLSNDNSLDHKHSNSSKWRLSLVFKGFPDKDSDKYLTEEKDITPQKEKWEKLTSELPQDGNINIYLIRHGNALHNKPLQLVGSSALGKLFNRNLDTNLTPLGIHQARMLARKLTQEGLLHGGDNSVFCASYLNRAQHTCLELYRAVHKNNNDKLIQLEHDFTRRAVKRLKRKMDTDNLDQIIGELTSNEDNIKKLCGVEESKECSEALHKIYPFNDINELP